MSMEIYLIVLVIKKKLYIYLTQHKYQIKSHHTSIRRDFVKKNIWRDILGISIKKEKF